MPDEPHASALLRWPASIPDIAAQQTLPARTAEQATPGQLIGFGSGSQAYLALWALGRRVSEQHLDVAVVCTSFETETAAMTLGLNLVALGTVEPDWGLDSADEIDVDNRLLKSHGAGLVKERLLWSTAKRMYLAIEPSQFVTTLGRTLALPLEVHRDAVSATARELERLGADDVQLRLSTGKDGPVFTESGNLLLDARFAELAPGLGAELLTLPGVVETGLFEGYTFETL